MDSLNLIIASLHDVLVVIGNYWWLWLPLLLVLTAWNLYINHAELQYLLKMKWVVLEVQVPREPHKSPRAFENIFSAFHVISGDKKGFWETFGKDGFLGAWNYDFGKIPDWISLEIAGINGEIHFFIRTPEQYRNLIEAQIYGQYSSAVITQTNDYVAELPEALPNDEVDVTGGELSLTKEDAYPIKTYPDFEEQGGGKDDVKRIDPLASLAETMALLKPGELLAIQLLVAGTSKGKNIQPVIDKIMDKPAKPRNDFLDKTVSSIDSLMGVVPAVPEKKEEKPFSQLGPGKQEIIKAIEKAATKLPFKSGIRYLYVAPKDRFVKERAGGVMASFKQLSTNSLNGFKPSFGIGGPSWFKSKRDRMTFESKVEIYGRFRSRAMLNPSYTLNTEELATIYHFPDTGVETAALPRVEAKTGEPPAGLPTA